MLILSGPSGAGKTTLAEELLRLSPDPCIHLEADRAVPEVTSVDVHTVIRTFHRSVATWCEDGISVILDGSLPYGNTALRAQCLDALQPHRTVIVGVDADRDVLISRARARGHSDPEWGASQKADVNSGLAITASVDTSGHDMGTVALELAHRLGWRTER